MPAHVSNPESTVSVPPDEFAQLRHDLRTPIGHIIGYAEMLREEAMDNGGAAHPDLERIEAAGRQLLQIMDERMTPRSSDGAVPVPVSVRSSEHAAEPGHVIAVPAPELTGILLVVDNDAENRDVFARRLQRLGHHAVTTPSGREALALLHESVFDLVLLDVQMPEMDGYEVLSQIKADPDISHTPVIMISASDDLLSVARCIELGAEDYLPKPCDATLLRARVNSSLRVKRAHDREKYLTDELQANFTRLQAAERQRDDLTSMIVHDMRTPLTSVLTGLQTLEGFGGLDSDQMEMLVISLDGAQTLLGMINDMLDVAKLEDSSLSLEYADVSISDLIDSASRQVALLAAKQGLNLERDIAGDLPPLRADSEKLRRVLVNLIGNALKFTPQGGTVTVGARREEDRVVFSVHDTGEGIPKEAFGRIFEKFGQVESRKGGRRMSTGLGLTFCKMAVEAHGGRVWVESELGVGSTFLFEMPIGS